MLKRLFRFLFTPEPEEEQRILLAITYKSGREVIVSCRAYSTKQEEGRLVDLEILDIRPFPVYIGHLSEIESIWMPTGLGR